MADTGQQKWSPETGGWVDHADEVESPETVEQEAQPVIRPGALRSQRVIGQGTVKRLPQLSMVLLGAAILAAIILAVTMLNKPTSAAPAFQDLGPGVSNVAGLKGHLVARWEKHAQYMLSFEPLFGIYKSGFSYTVGHPPGPLWINVRLLDSTGYALCGKQIEFRFNQARSNVDLSLLHEPGAKMIEVSNHGPASAAAQPQRPAVRTIDLFQNEMGDNGQVASVFAQGVLPCSAEQYKKFNYWDFSTNFPSLEQQEALMKAPAIAAARAAEAARQEERRREARSPHFFVEGDTSVDSYESASATLVAGTGQSFILTKKNQSATADAWAENNARIHYKCDTLANCTLTRAGDGRIVDARSIH